MNQNNSDILLEKVKGYNVKEKKISDLSVVSIKSDDSIIKYVESEYEYEYLSIDDSYFKANNINTKFVLDESDLNIDLEIEK